MADFNTQLIEYANAVERFRTGNELPSEWFAKPDHIAVKCADSLDYEWAVTQWLEHASELSYVRLNNRRLASARLLSPLTIGGLGRVEWLEIMEPRPEKVGKDTVGIDHMEFVFDDFDAAAALLHAKDIAFEKQANPNHEWLSVLAYGHEFKLNNKILADIVASELASGEAMVLK